MLLEYFDHLGGASAVQAIRAFLDSRWYPALCVVLMVCANFFSAELFVFYCYFFLGLLVVLFADDLKGIIPIVPCCYMSISYENNPALFPSGSASPSAFYDPEFVSQLIFLIGAAVLMLLARFISLLWGREKRRMPSLTAGFLLLGASFVCGGLFSGFYESRTALFGFAVSVSLCATYFFFYYGVDWRKTERTDWAELCVLLCAGLSAELLGMYLKSGILADPSLTRGVLITGWGMYNNVGCILAMFLPAFQYLAVKKENGWLYAALSYVFYLFLILTQSRGSILFGTVLFAAGVAGSLVFAGKKRRDLLIVGGCAAAVFALTAIVILCSPLRETMKEIFSDVLAKGTDDNGREEIYREGILHFRSHPAFGVGFYQCTAFRWGWGPSSGEKIFLASRYHNTLIQVLASGGIFSGVCYLVHRVQTVRLLFCRFSVEKIFLALGIAALLCTSLVECHFFSFGPGLLYGLFLVYAEGEDLRSAPPFRKNARSL